MSDSNESNARLDDIIVVAEGTDYERKIKKTLPRGKSNRGITAKIINSIRGMQGIFDAQDEGVSLEDVGQAMEVMFEYPHFFDILLPAALGLRDPKTGNVSKEDEEWLDNLTDMERMMAYAECAGYIAENGDMASQVQAASKKSKGGSGGVKATN